jgi:hypothetical protein
MRELRKPPAPWLFSLLILPLGVVVVGFNFTAFPLLLAQAGVPVDRIASISSIINLPGVIGFLFAPIVDIKFRRRTWLVLASFGTALSACLYFPASSNGRCNTIWYKAVFKGGVYETRKTVWAFGGAETRRVASLESRADVA